MMSTKRIAIGLVLIVGALLLAVWARAQNIPGTAVTDSIVPSATSDTYPTHQALYGKGGLRTVSNLTDLTSIPAARREAGMQVYVITNGITYVLGSDKTNWVPTVPKIKASTFAELASLPAPYLPDGTIVETEGYYEAGDGGGHQYRLNKGGSVTNVGEPSATGSGIWQLHQWDGNVRAFGAVRDVLTSQSSSIQAASDYLEANGGGVLRFESGVWAFDRPFRLGYRVSLEGDSSAWDNTEKTETNDVDQLRVRGTVFVLLAGSNCKLMTNSIVGPVIRQTGTYDGRGFSIDQRMQNSTIRNITFDGQGHLQTSNNCDLVYFLDVLGVRFENCFFFRPRGRLGTFWNVNVGRMENCDYLGDRNYSKGFLLMGTSDFQIFGGMGSATRGPAIWLAEEDSWLNTYQGGHHGDADSGLVNITSIAGNLITTDEDPLVEDGEPVVFIADVTANLPTGITQGETYFAKRVTTNTFYVADGLTNLLASSYVTLSGGTAVRFGPGPGVGLFASGTSKLGSVVNVRFDAGEDAGVWLENASYNSFENCVFSRSPHGIHISESSYWNTVVGNQFWDNGIAIFNRSFRTHIAHNGFFQNDTNWVQLSGDNWGMQNGTTFTRANSGFALTVDGPGAQLIEIARTSGTTNKTWLGHSSLRPESTNTAHEAFQVYDGDLGRVMLSLGVSNSAMHSVVFGADTGTPLPVLVRPGNPTGTDQSGVRLALAGGAPTGAGVGGTVDIEVAPIGANGTGVRVHQVVARFDASTISGHTRLILWDSSSGTLKRVGVTNVGGNDLLYLVP